MDSNMKRVRTKDLIVFMKCPICNKLLKNAVTINECLHTFCQKCIYDKINEEDLHSCPVCNTDLGCAPLQRLRPDHNMRSLKQSIFASLKRTPKVPEKETKQSKASKPAETDFDKGPSTEAKMPSAETDLDKGPSTEAKLPSAETDLDKDASIETTTPSVPYPGRRKERSLLSLVNPTTSSAAKNGRRKSSNPRRFTADLSVIEELPTEDVEDPQGISNSPLALRKNTIQKKNQKNKGKDPILVPLEGITDLWKPLNCLVEAAEMTRSNRSNSKGIVFKEPPISNVPEDEAMIMSKTEGKKPCVDTSDVPVNVDNEDCGKGANSGILASKGKMVKKGKRGKRGRKKSVVATSSEGRRTSPQPVVNAATSSSYSQRMMSSIWLSLVASPNQEGVPPLRQISSRYLMIKNAQVAVSIIKKYLVRKLDLQSEDEVEISMRGLPLPPSLELCSLVDIWSRTSNKPDMTTVAVGSSAKDHVIVLSYGRKA